MVKSYDFELFWMILKIIECRVRFLEADPGVVDVCDIQAVAIVGHGILKQIKIRCSFINVIVNLAEN